ncbi:hypothetical protein OBBRIDRAFT_839893 [Obba rivulosa]|uniref:Uncharacterized protein n=1 Tax=Obba rivulosa TaxID=1052685 RepID=A0A8E2AS36_9APHY|nr:hypothetical protein OBBRIDRAFT_839893 [Obba rivulosa]
MSSYSKGKTCEEMPASVPTLTPLRPSSTVQSSPLSGGGSATPLSLIHLQRSPIPRLPTQFGILGSAPSTPMPSSSIASPVGTHFSSAPIHMPFSIPAATTHNAVRYYGTAVKNLIDRLQLSAAVHNLCWMIEGSCPTQQWEFAVCEKGGMSVELAYEIVVAMKVDSAASKRHRAPVLSQERCKEIAHQNQDKRNRINADLAEWYQDTVALLQHLSQKYGKKPGHYLNMMFSGANKMGKKRKTNLYNAWGHHIAKRAQEDNNVLRKLLALEKENRDAFDKLSDEKKAELIQELDKEKEARTTGY